MTQIEIVHFYERLFYMLSNFSAFKVWWRGLHFMTAEHAYQAAKFWRLRTFWIVLRIWRAPSAHEAKQIAKCFQHLVRPDWDDDMKIAVMKSITWAKLRQHLIIQEMLRRSGDATLIEDSPLDSFWGWGPDRRGLNWLGKIWMEHRLTLGFLCTG